jgi:peptidoglycan/LPS O-acetylase OafA/YrhL
MQFVGVTSYSLYLWQQLFLHPGATGFAQAFPQNVGLAFLAAAASYHLIEKPCLALEPASVPSSSNALAVGPAGN